MAPIKITSSYGYLLVDRESGNVITRRILAKDKYSLELSRAFWFDLEEYYTFRDDLKREDIDEIDVCAIPYKYRNALGEVQLELPAYEWREDLKTPEEN